MTPTSLSAAITRWTKAYNAEEEESLLRVDAKGAEECALYTLAALLDLRVKCEGTSYISGREISALLAPIIHMERGVGRELVRLMLKDDLAELPGLCSGGGKRHLAEIVAHGGE